MNFDLRICESMGCKILVAPGFIPGIVNARGKKVRPQKVQKAKTLHAPQNKNFKFPRRCAYGRILNFDERIPIKKICESVAVEF